MYYQSWTKYSSDSSFIALDILAYENLFSSTLRIAVIFIETWIIIVL